MVNLIASPNRVLQFGYEGEDNVTQIIFNYDESWLSYGDGEFKVRVLRPGDKEAYNATDVVDNRSLMTLVMTVTDIELSRKGRGELQLVYICHDVVKKSEIYTFVVRRAIDSEVVDPPDGSIIASVEESLAEIKDEIGSLSELTTTDKTSLVGAINEVNAKEVEVTVDSELSDTSERPVQNKTIKAYVDNAVSHVTIDVDSELSVESENPVQNKVVKAKFDSVDQTVAGIGGRLATAETALEGKANTADMNTALALKANSADMQTALAGKASTDVATQSANGLMSAQDKTKLDGLGDSGVSDVQIGGTSVVTDGVANVPIAEDNTSGVVRVGESGTYGIKKWSNTQPLLVINSASSNFIKNPNSGNTANYRPITPTRQHESTFYGLAKAAGDATQSASSNAVGTYTETAKSKISDMLNGAVQVEGTTPTITALSGVRYVCGEVATLDITPCASGICDIVFTSGSTATVLTLPSTVKFPDGAFTPEANTTYEINIMDGIYGAVMAWI